MSIKTPAAQVKVWVQILWEFMVLHQQLKPADAIVVLGNFDLRTADRGAELWHKKLAPQVIVTGGFGRPAYRWDRPEAEVFADRMITAGVPTTVMTLEKESTNTGDNFNFTKKLLTTQGRTITTAIIVTKPYMQRRALATAQKVWPEVQWQVTASNISYDNYHTEQHPEEDTIQFLVGDVQRMWVYPEKGWQVPVAIPTSVKEAWTNLVNTGYTREVIPEV